MGKAIFIVIFLILLFGSVKQVHAIYDPTSVLNNRFGIHIIDEGDLEDAAKLVNNKGDWGYVTLVIRENDLDQEKWQRIFDKMRKLKLIPILRLATTTSNTYWEKPSPEDAPRWANFLNSLNWAIKNRYVVLFNEPNHDKEWGGSSSASEYTEIVKAFAKEFRQTSSDFFILPAGMDLAAGNSKDTQDALQFFKKMYQTDKSVFTLFDGWVSHSYPNPGSSGKPSDQGRKSIRGFAWELTELEKLNLPNHLPIFITETGWVHKEGVKENKDLISAIDVSKYFEDAFKNAWNNPKIVAVTPFVLNYLAPPFDHFSWKSLDGFFYPPLETVSNLEKTKGEPLQVHDASFVTSPLPDQLFTNSTYNFEILIKNKGQSVWNENDFKVRLETDPDIEAKSLTFPSISPGEEGLAKLTFHASDLVKRINVKMNLEYKGKTFGQIFEKQIEIITPPSLSLRIKKGIKPVRNESGFTLLVYDGVDAIKTVDEVSFSDYKAQVASLSDIVPKKTYRFVLLKPFNLPRQRYTFVAHEQTEILFDPFIPIDFNNDGKFSVSDIFHGITHPIDATKVLF